MDLVHLLAGIFPFAVVLAFRLGHDRGRKVEYDEQRMARLERRQ